MRSNVRLSMSIKNTAFAFKGAAILALSIFSGVVGWAQKPELVVQTGHSNFVMSIAFSPDGKTLVSGSWDQTVKLWDVATGAELRTFKGHSAYIDTVAFSSDGTTLASGSQDKTIKLWDASTGKELHTLRDADSVSSLTF